MVNKIIKINYKSETTNEFLMIKKIEKFFSSTVKSIQTPIISDLKSKHKLFE